MPGNRTRRTADPSRSTRACRVLASLSLALLVACAQPVRPATGDAAAATTQELPSVATAVADLRERVIRTQPPQEITSADPDDWRDWMRPEETQALATRHVRFRIDKPAVVSVFVDERLTEDEEPFWLEERGFVRADLAIAEAAGRDFAAWQKTFPAGEVGLGIHALRDYREHYFVTVAAVDGTPVTVTDLFPQGLEVDTLREGASVYSDRSAELESAPASLLGQTLIRTQSRGRRAAALYRHYRLTEHPPSAAADQFVLTWSGDPATTQAIQWRTNTDVDSPTLLYAVAASGDAAPAWQSVTATTTRLDSPRVLDFPTIHRHTVELRGLQPGTRYAYAVAGADGRPAGGLRHFDTAPRTGEGFSFLYLGDAQEGFERFGEVLQKAYRTHPDARFAIIPGDLVNDGHLRDEWDALLAHASPVLGRIPLVPAIGNHEVLGREPRLYLDLFALPRNGPGGVAPERAYHFVYGDALFLVLDSNLDAATQSEWLERTLAGATQRWKIVVAHHPAYPSRADRYYADMREAWAPIMERYGVQLVLQGHDHAYLRTHPMRDGRRAGDGQGTVYVLSNAGTKFYEQGTHDYAAASVADRQFWQVIEIDPATSRLRFRAYDDSGTQIDAFELK